MTKQRKTDIFFGLSPLSLASQYDGLQFWSKQILDKIQVGLCSVPTHHSLKFTQLRKNKALECKRREATLVILIHSDQKLTTTVFSLLSQCYNLNKTSEKKKSIEYKNNDIMHF